MDEHGNPLLHEELSGLIRQTAFETHRYFGPGFLEKVYENVLVNRLRKKGLDVKAQQALVVHDEDGTVVGDYDADLFVESCVVVEVKAARALAGEHVAQLLNYLKASRTQLGLLINFGATKLEYKRFVFGYGNSVSSACSVANDLTANTCPSRNIQNRS
jgi:GxxExxY protein